jgi:hypothetical protein
MYAENTQEYLNPAKNDKIGPGSLENASINRRSTHTFLQLLLIYLAYYRVSIAQRLPTAILYLL